MSTYLLWDIDGTLLSTARAGIFAWEDAAQEILGEHLDFSALRTAGLTDAEIALHIAGGHGCGDAAAAGALLRRYAELLPAALPRRQGEVLPNVREILEALEGRDDVVSMLLTGNVAAGAEAKLRHYDLWDFFAHTGGAFSVEGSDRVSIARAAAELAARHAGAAPDPDSLVVIGDTPHDVRCGKAIGARTVAVATGPDYDRAALEACEPWLALDRLPRPAAFGEALGLRAHVWVGERHRDH